MEVTWCCVVLCTLTFCCTLPWSYGLEPRLALCFNGYRYAHYLHFANWTTARDLCQTINFGNLTSIDNQAQQDYFSSNFNGSSVSVWIGLNDINVEGNFTWVDGSLLNFTDWSGTEDTNTSYNKDCVVMQRRLTGTWGEVPCNNIREFLCRETVPAPEVWTNCGGREWRMFEENMTWSNAESTCQNYGGHLAYLEDDQSRSTCAKRALQTCFRDGPQIDMAYTGLTNIFDLTYRWVRDNSMTNLSSSQMLPPHLGSRYCSTFTKNTIEFVNCSLEYPFICERSIPPNRPPFTASCNISNMTYNTLAFSWQHANNNCLSTGGRLLKPTAVDERECALQLFDMHFSGDSTIRDIMMWVSLDAQQCTSSMCPKWQFDLDSSETQNISCDTPAPYICVYEAGSTMVPPVTCQLGEVSTETIVGIVGGFIAIAAAAALVIAIIQKRKQRKRTESASQLSDSLIQNSNTDTFDRSSATCLKKIRVRRTPSELQTSPALTADNTVYTAPVLGMTNAAYLANDDKILIDTVPVSYVNNETSKSPDTTAPEAMYDYAAQEPKPRNAPSGKSSFIPNRHASQGKQQTKDRYVANPSVQGATKVSFPKKDVQTESDPSANIYSVIAAVRNRVPYQSPPNDENEIYSTLNDKTYVHLDRKSIDIDQQIGVGNFGYVMQATWRRRDNVTIPVAVKSLRPDVEGAGKIEFLKEAVIMGQFYHRNVVTMLGVVVDSDPYLLVLDLMKTALQPYLFGLREDDKEVVPLLTRFAVDIASGMEYLSSREFVHRDLAARNILLDGQLTCKIGDFGMSRNLDDGDYYISQNTGPIPVKWTAPEALEYKRYSTGSDVWSFAVVVYEIFAFGRKPFFGMKNEEVLERVCKGYRLERPTNCPQTIYDLQTKCWDEDPHRRPTFSELRQQLEVYEKELATDKGVSG